METPHEIAMLVLPKGYTRDMAKVMVSFPDDLLSEIDLEAERQGTTRSGLRQAAARHEIGIRTAEQSADLIRRMELAAEEWTFEGDTTAMIREDRNRDE